MAAPGSASDLSVALNVTYKDAPHESVVALDGLISEAQRAELLASTRRIVRVNVHLVRQRAGPADVMVFCNINVDVEKT